MSMQRTLETVEYDSSVNRPFQDDLRDRVRAYT